MAASGLVEDQIALRLRTDKNQLRRKYIDSIKQGRAIARAQAEANDGLTRAERLAADSMLSSCASKWFDPTYGNLLWPGLNGSGARTPAEAFAAWMLRGSKFNHPGLADNFSDERIAEFVALKREALKLLGNGG